MEAIRISRAATLCRQKSETIPAPRAGTGCRREGGYFLTPEKKRQWLWFVGLSLGGIAATWLLVRLTRMLVQI